MKKIRRQRGFTLLEIMIALTIFAVISTLAWQILDGAMRTLMDLPGGRVPLVLVAAGFAAYALYSGARARYARL